MFKGNRSILNLFTRPPLRRALRVSLLYTLAAGLWILLSDKILAYFVSDPNQLMLFAIYKGWFFVLVTASLLFLERKWAEDRFARLLELEKDARAEIERAERLANYSEHHFHALIENAPDGIVLIGPTGRFKYASPFAYKMFGYDEEDVIDKNLADLTHPDDLPAVLAVLAALNENPAHVNMLQYRFLQKGGAWRWVESTFSNLLAEPSVEALVINFRDITERKFAEERLKKRNDEIKLLYDAGQELGRSLELDQLHQTLYRYISQVVDCSALYISSFDSQEKTISCVFAVGDGNCLDVSAFPAIPLEPEGSGTQSQVIRTGKPWLINDYQAQVKTARNKHYVDESGNVLGFDEVARDANVTRSAIIVPLMLRDQVRGVVQVFSYKKNAYAQDDLNFVEALSAQFAVASNNALLYQKAQAEIIERRRIESALLREEQRYRDIFENSPVSLWEEDFSAVKRYLEKLKKRGVIDFKAYLSAHPAEAQKCAQLVRVIDVNQETLTLFRADSKEHFLGDLAHLVSGDELDSFIDELVNIAAGKSQFGWEGRNTTFDGTPVDISLNWSVSTGYEESLSKVIVSIIDITERKNAEREIQHHLSELEVLYENSRDISRLLEPRKIGQKLIDILAEKLDWHHATVRMYNAETDKVELLALGHPGLTAAETKEQIERLNQKIAHVGVGLSGWVLQHGVSVCSPQVKNDPRYIETYPEIQSGLYVPIRIGERTVGAIAVESEKEAAFSEQDERLLTTLASQAAISIENAQLFSLAQKELSERVRIEDELKELNRTLEQRVEERTGEVSDLYNNAPCGYHSLDSAGKIVHINNTELHWLGYTADEVLGKPIMDFVTEESRAIFREGFPIFMQRGYLDDLELTFVRKSGSTFPALVSATAIYDTAGEFVMSRSTVFDVTERKKAAELLERQNKSMLGLYNVTLLLFQQTEIEQMLQIIVDESSRLLNSPHVEINMLQDENTLEVRATTPELASMLGTVSERGKKSFLSWRAIEAGEPILNENYSEYPLRMDAYNSLSLGATAQIPIKSDRVIGILSIGRDFPSLPYNPEEISIASLMAQLAAVAIQSAQLYNQIADELNKRRTTEDALRRSRDELSIANAALEKAARLKDEFLASMSHELRTPLTGILGLSEALQLMTYGDLNEKQRRALKNIETSGRHLLDLINDILDLSKIEAGKLEMQFEPCALPDICQAGLQLTKGMAHQKRQVVSFSINPASIVVRADSRRLKQMLVNLLSNAVKFTPAGGSLGLEVQGSETEKVVRVSVWDHGIGIKREDMEKLFVPFIQLDSSLSRQQSGTGLGLSLVQRMAELHGGSIQVESTPGEGSRFTILLPWIPETTQPLPSVWHNTTMVQQVLTIEDHALDAELVTRYLRSLRINNAVHATGADVVEKIKEVHPNVILLDINLGGKSGWDVLKEIKADEASRQVPVVITSVEDDRARALSLGAAGYLVKPFGQEDLRIELERVVATTAHLSRLWKATTYKVGTTIVVADDNEVILETISDYLEAQNYRVITARNGRELIELIAEFHPGIVLMDIQMPGMDGLEAARRIRSHPDPVVAEVPLIAITALAMPGDRERCLLAGADEYLSKPVQLDNLVRIIEMQLAQKEKR